MKHKILKTLTVALALTSAAQVTHIIPVTHVADAASAKIKLPSSYKLKDVQQVNEGTISKKHLTRLKKASRTGMKTNNYTDTSKKDNDKIINVKKLSKKDQKTLAKFALKLINQARAKTGSKKWTYSNAAQNFATRVGNEYTKHDKSNLDPDHYFAGIKRVANKSGLNSHAGQVYEDMASLPISTKWHTDKRSMANIKEGIYFNICQMLFGGWYGNDLNSLSRYTEWEHASDLLSANRYEYKAHRYFGFSMSYLKNNPAEISTHFLSVNKKYIVNSKKFKWQKKAAPKSCSFHISKLEAINFY